MNDISALISLPNEVIELIAQHIGNDLKHLRLVCRQIDKVVFDVYKKHFFTELRVFLATEPSLRRAVNLMTHSALGHSTLGSAVRKLVLVDDSITDPSLEFELEAWVVLPAQKDLFKSGLDRILLVELFRQCMRIGKVSTILYRSFIQGRDGPPQRNQDGYTDHHCFINAMLSINDANASFNTFTMDTLDTTQHRAGGSRYVGIEIIESRDYPDNIACITALNRFERLDLVLNAGSTDDLNFVEHQHDFLADVQASKIRSLTFTPRGDYDSNVELDMPIEDFGCSPLAIEALFRLELPSLESLTIRWAEVCWKPLVLFLQRQTSLRTLVLDSMHVTSVTGTLLTKTSDRDVSSAEYCVRLSELTGVANVVDNGGNKFRLRE